MRVEVWSGGHAATPDGQVLASLVDVLAQAPLFAALLPDQQRALGKIASLQHFAPGERIVTEGGAPQAVFIVAAGEVDVARRLAGETEPGQIRRLGPGETFGEIALLGKLPVSASVTAATPTILVVLPLADLRRLLAEDPSFAPLYRGLARQLSSRLRSLTEVTVRALEGEVAALRARIVVGTLLIAVIAILSAFTYSLGLQAQLARAGLQQPVVLVLCLFGLGTVGLTMRLSRLPASFFGFTTRGWRAAVREAVLASLAFISALLALKWMVIRTVPAWHDVPLFYLQALVAEGDAAGLQSHLIQLAVYVLVVVPLQEVIIRGCAQGTLEEFLVGRHRVILAILTSNLIFSVTHSYLSPQFALLTLLPGLLWGWLYQRHRTLIGPIVAHTLVGVAAMDVIGVLELYR